MYRCVLARAMFNRLQFIIRARHARQNAFSRPSVFPLPSLPPTRSAMSTRQRVVSVGRERCSRRCITQRLLDLGPPSGRYGTIVRREQPWQRILLGCSSLLSISLFDSRASSSSRGEGRGLGDSRRKNRILGQVFLLRLHCRL